MGEDLKAVKAALRAAFLERRRGLSPGQVSAWSAAAVARLRDLPEAAEASAYLVYLSSKDNELDTLRLVETLLEEGRIVLVPVGDKNRSLVWSRLERLAETAPSAFGILEPRAEHLRPTEVPPGALAVVPGLAFTREGGRIGYGAGYYDRFLAAFDGVKLGMAFEAQLADSMPLEAHDVPMDVVVTEAAVYRRS
ncbi:MAG: 5-formyltetrahydrofolate cyclo-ligase [FCB group bacterium]|jgi:5-formyltetrahydrofolate cyclo-ligase|nr:5-formyltetrahydrofolate cyclo-ligase [FCB group bacterium]